MSLFRDPVEHAANRVEHLLRSTREETAAAYLRAEYGHTVADKVIAEVVAGLSDAELDAIEAAVQAQPWLAEVPS